MVGGYVEEEIAAVGIDVSPIRRSDAMLVAYKVEARPRLNEYELATTQDHWAIDERGRAETQTRSFTLVREGTTDLLKKVPQFAEAKGPHVPQVGKNGSPWQEPINAIEEKNKKENNPVPQWGMSIDLTKCIGCNACVIACQSENNVPIVGREQVLNSREMHWLRIDRYFQGDEENADIVQEPVACMHCETAPCEQVCPVAATVHTNEGINAMAYNRCIGTRYCANNCPFKVRRFNYFNYNQDIGVGYGIDAYQGTIESANRKLQALVMNPQVTVRGRGVMEKCTYCVQRVENAKITARKEDRTIADGDVVTACQSACPTRAIEFGNIADENSVVAKKHADVRSYGMLGQLNIKPRTEYLARVRNPHKRLMTAKQLEDLVKVEAPHHGDHAHEDHAGEDHAHDEHAHDEHADEAQAHGEADAKHPEAKASEASVPEASVPEAKKD
jgi:molybdopterin-containing oxidoreductase family iron-sulfur binding subunit